MFIIASLHESEKLKTTNAKNKVVKLNKWQDIYRSTSVLTNHLLEMVFNKFSFGSDIFLGC